MDDESVEFTETIHFTCLIFLVTSFSQIGNTPPTLLKSFHSFSVHAFWVTNGSGDYPGKAGSEAGVQPGWDTGPSQGTTHLGVIQSRQST